MTTLTLRTRLNVTAASSSSRSSVYQERAPRAATRGFRPVFLSSPSPRRTGLRVRRAI
jgi:hypothetical protein